MSRLITTENLERWKEHGAIWPALELSEARAVVEFAPAAASRSTWCRATHPS